MIWTRVKGKTELWYLESENYSGIFRSLNGRDLQYLEDNDFQLSNSAQVSALVKRLELSTQSDLEDLELPEFNRVLKTLLKNLVEKQIIQPETWLELVFIAGGKRFEPSFEPWLEVPIPVLLVMSKIAGKYLQSF